jgi:CMP-N,N'-diacetyllegionaminic acid synthase
MKVLYFIPARGGSKGLPGKNIKKLAGKPLIVWSIDAAKNADLKGDIIVSTDDEAIALIAKNAGASVPFIRPASLAQDTTPTVDVLFHLLEIQQQKNIKYDLVVLLQPTSPLRTAADINEAYQLFKTKNCSAIVSVCECDHHPLWSNELPEDLSMKNFIRPEIKGKNRQQLPKYYMLNGAVFIAKINYLMKQRAFVSDEATAFIMPKERSLDIDSEADFVLAEYFIAKKKK